MYFDDDVNSVGGLIVKTIFRWSVACYEDEILSCSGSRLPDAELLALFSGPEVGHPSSSISEEDAQKVAWMQIAGSLTCLFTS